MRLEGVHEWIPQADSSKSKRKHYLNVERRHKDNEFNNLFQNKSFEVTGYIYKKSRGSTTQRELCVFSASLNNWKTYMSVKS